MGDLVLLSKAQMRRIEPYFALSHGVPRVDDCRIVSGIIFVIRNGLRWCDASAGYGPHKTIYNRIFEALAAKGGRSDQLMIDATHLKAHRTAASLLKSGCSPPYRTHQRRPELRAAYGLRRSRPLACHAPERRADERLKGSSSHPPGATEDQGSPRQQGLRRRLAPPGSGRAARRCVHSVKGQSQGPDTI
jgi:putative transposase